MPAFPDALNEPSGNPWAWMSSVDPLQDADAFGLPGLGLSDTNWLSPQYQDTMDVDALLANLGANHHANGEQLASSVAPTSPPNHAIVAQQPSSHQVTITFDTDQAPSVADSGNSTVLSENIYYVDGDGARAPFGGRCQDSNCSVEANDLPNSEPNETIAPSNISPTNLLCSSGAYESLIQGIAAESQNGLLDMNAITLPTNEQINLYVRQYFEKFHPAFPFLRRSSFVNDVSTSWLLLLAVSAVGAKFVQQLQLSRTGEQMLRLLNQILTRCKYGLEQLHTEDVDNADYTPGRRFWKRTCPDLPLLQAGILNVACLLHSGKTALLERAIVERHYLVEACHSLHLLAYTECIGLENTDHPDRARVVHDWLVRESKIRTGMMIWVLDSMFVYEFQTKPLLRLHDVKATLPSHEDVWEQPNLVQLDYRHTSNITLADALETMYVEKKLPPDLGELSMGILINAIYRNTKDILVRDQTRLNSWTPTALPQRRSEIPSVQQDWLPTTRLATKWRNSACDCLDILHWPANSKAARCSGFEHPTILQLHLARLIILTPTSSIETFAAGPGSRNLSSTDLNDDQAFAIARVQVLQWLPEVSKAITYGSDENPEPSFLHLDRPLDDELVQTYVRVGNKMSAYIANVGSIRDQVAPTRILKEGISLLAKHSQTVSGTDKKPAARPQDPICTWGIERSYTNLLSNLIDQEQERIATV
ncbi:hypothetical protein N0V90_011715 [Kalmusia sp. IMI 367209]|nr:hypothetical protein N0V90_011715 [Kalmusia sp. IMI 367209]